MEKVKSFARKNKNYKVGEKMLKEIIICIIIITTIFVGNIISQKYTTESVDEIVDLLDNIKIQIQENNGEIDINIMKEKINDLNEKWKKRHEKLAYYIEHDELEKVNSSLVRFKSYIEQEDYQEAITELEECKYILEHIKDKQRLQVINLF